MAVEFQPKDNKNELILIPACINNHTLGKVWDESTYPFQIFNGGTTEVWE